MSLFSTSTKRAALEDAIEESRECIAECQHEAQEVRAKLADAEKVRQQLASDHLKVSEEVRVHHSESSSLQAKLLKARAQADGNRLEMEACQRDFDKEQAEVDRLREELTTLREKRAMLDRACEELPLSPRPQAASGKADNLARGMDVEEKDRCTQNPECAQVSSLPLVGMAAEAAELSKKEHQTLELQFTDIAAKTVAVDREREVLENEVRVWQEELEQLRKDHSKMQELRTGAAEALKLADSEVNTLQQQHDSFQAKLKEATKEFEIIEDNYARTNALLGQNRQETEALRDMAWEELWDAEHKLSRTSRIKQYAAGEAERHQKELVKLTVAHSQMISASDGYDLGLGGTRGLPDMESPDMRAAVQKASHPPYGQTPRDRDPLSARGPRSELVGAGQHVVGATM